MQRFLPISALLAAVIAIALPATSQARYVGPSIMDDKPSVQGILAKPVDGQPVQLQGKLLRQISRHHYLFSDGTAEITVEIDAEDFPRKPVDQNTLVEIIGEVDTGLKRPPSIEVDALSIVE